MQDFTNQRTDATPDELWILQHPSVYTLGQAGKPEHLLNPGQIPVIKTDRGGQVTWHGPGQLVIYLLLNLRRYQLGVRDLVTLIEQSLVACLADLGITAYPRADAPGVYVKQDDQTEAKIAALGLRIRKGCSFHGLSLNIDCDLQPFAGINPCGYSGLAVTRVSDLNSEAADFASITQTLLTQLIQALGSPSTHSVEGWSFDV